MLAAWTCLYAATAAAANEYRQPPAFSARSIGHYGPSPWRSPDSPKFLDKFYERTEGWDFGIKPITNNEHTTPAMIDRYVGNINQELKGAQSYPTPKSMLLRIDFWNSGKERYDDKTPLQPYELYEKRLSDILDRVDTKNPSLAGLVLAEENVPSNNRHAEVLQRLYLFLKKRYPGIKVWQWYSPNRTIPGVYRGVDVQADGWIINPYTLDEKWYPDEKYGMGKNPYRWVLQKYLDTKKPVICIIYAATDRAFYYNPNDPRNRFKVNMWDIKENQFTVNQEKNVATAFYWQQTLPSTGQNTLAFGRKVEGDALMQRINDKVDEFVRRARDRAE